MAIFIGDVVIKTMIDLSIEEMRKSPWLVQDALAEFVTNRYLKEKYGQKLIDSCKEWLKNNQIDIYMRPRIQDRDRTPCITITMGNGPERPEMKSMGDLDVDSSTLAPNEIGKPIPYILKPFAPISYTQSTG